MTSIRANLRRSPRNFLDRGFRIARIPQGEDTNLQNLLTAESAEITKKDPLKNIKELTGLVRQTSYDIHFYHARNSFPSALRSLRSLRLKCLFQVDSPARFLPAHGLNLLDLFGLRFSDFRLCRPAFFVVNSLPEKTIWAIVVKK
jgi:hypothetical protein